MGKLSAPEILLILLVLILLFGARKLPETARGLGRSLRIFKAETKGLRDDDERGPDQQRTQDGPSLRADPEPPRPLTSGPASRVDEPTPERDRTDR